MRAELTHPKSASTHCYTAYSRPTFLHAPKTHSSHRCVQPLTHGRHISAWLTVKCVLFDSLSWVSKSRCHRHDPPTQQCELRCRVTAPPLFRCTPITNDYCWMAAFLSNRIKVKVWLTGNVTTDSFELLRRPFGVTVCAFDRHPARTMENIWLLLRIGAGPIACSDAQGTRWRPKKTPWFRPDH